MRILLIDVNYGLGSTRKILKDLKVELEKQGHEVLACYGRGKKVKEKNIILIKYLEIKTKYKNTQTKPKWTQYKTKQLQW